jgi:membrane protease subunit HflK
MYLDAMQQIYGNVTKIIVDSKQGSNMLYLPLDKIMQMGASGSDASVVGSPATTNAPAHTALPNTAANDARSREAARTRERESR